MSKRARIHDLYQHLLDSAAIEKASFAAIDRESSFRWVKGRRP